MTLENDCAAKNLVGYQAKIYERTDHSQGDITTCSVHHTEGNNKPHDTNHERDHDMESTLAGFVGVSRYDESDDSRESPWRSPKKKRDSRRVPHRSRQGWAECIE